MRRLINEELSTESKVVDDAIFSTVTSNDQFKCVLCHDRFENEHEQKCIIDGVFRSKIICKTIHIELCGNCSFDLNLIEMEEN